MNTKRRDRRDEQPDASRRRRQDAEEPEIEVEVITDLSPTTGQHLIRGGGGDPTPIGGLR